MATAKPGVHEKVPFPQLRHATRPAHEFAATAEQILLERYCAAAFLVNCAGEALYLYGRTEPYLVRRSGAPTPSPLDDAPAGPARTAAPRAAQSFEARGPLGGQGYPRASGS